MKKNKNKGLYRPISFFFKSKDEMANISSGLKKVKSK